MLLLLAAALLLFPREKRCSRAYSQRRAREMRAHESDEQKKKLVLEAPEEERVGEAEEESVRGTRRRSPSHDPPNHTISLVRSMKLMRA
jgi:hypothetical protein